MEREIKKYSLFINGADIDSKNYYELLNPFDTSLIACIPLADASLMEKAIESAYSAFQVTREQAAYIRSDVLYRTAEILSERSEAIAQIISLEAAKPIRTARTEVSRTIQTFRFAAEEAKRLSGESIPMDAAIGGESKLAFTIIEPIGVIGAITPFNFPMNLVAHKVAPAIAAGNSIVLKPAEQTPISSLVLAKIMKEAGLVDGAFNVVTGDGATLGSVITSHPLIAKVSFTGSPEVGKLIRSQSGLKKVTLELGSNAALIVDKNVDIEKVVPKAVTAGFSYAGQVCIHTQRIYVHEEIFDAFVRRFAEMSAQLKTGSPKEEETDVSAVISERSLKRISFWVEEALANGATLTLGGTSNGNLMHPTVLTNVPETTKVVCEEVFGPVVVINPIPSVKEGIARANDSRYGLNVGIFTNHFETAFKSAKALEAGQVLINEVPTFRLDHMPYGGRKDSGVGKEGVRYAIKEMTEEKLIVLHI